MQPSIPVDGESSIIGRVVFKALIIVAYPPGKGRRYNVFLIHVAAQNVDHLHKDNAGFLIFVWSGKYLSVGKRVIVSLVVFDIIHGYRLYAPGMIYKYLSINTKGLVEPFFMTHRGRMKR